MSRVTRDSPGGRAYLDLQNTARRLGRPTQELLQLYVLEGFLARLAASSTSDQFVLKGGVLLAAFDLRRPTRDVDLAGVDMHNDIRTMTESIRRVLEVDLRSSDGLEFVADSVRGETIREGDVYSGVRVHAHARLASATLLFHVDINVGDPIWPAPATVAVPRLRGGEPIRLAGYPIPMVLAEKVVTAIQRGVVNTRWRDFADVWGISRQHVIAADELYEAIGRVAAHREAAVRPLSEVLEGYASLGQARWVQWRRRTAAEHIPEDFGALLQSVIDFVDPVVSGQVRGLRWNPDRMTWS